MTARTAPPAAVVQPLIDAELKAFDHNLRRWRIARAAIWRTGKAFGTKDPAVVVTRAAERITDHLEGGTP